MRFKLKILFYWLMYKARGRFTTADALARYQGRRLRRFIKNELNNAPFYKAIASLSLDKWKEIPVIDKQVLLANFRELNRPGLSRDEATSFAIDSELRRDFSANMKGITVGLSTGTSGNRGIFLVSETERAQWTAMMLHRVLKPKLFKKQKIAFFLRASSNLYSSVNSGLFQFAYFDIFRPVAELMQELQRYEPDILAAQPSMLIEICSYVRQGRLRIKPASVISFAEVLTVKDKIIIERTFGVVIKEVYQCMEGFLGCTCPHGTMHLNEDIVYIEKEFIDEHRFYPVITDFSRSTQWLVRYRLNDILKLKKDKCPCGSAMTALEMIEGRSDDVLLFMDRNRGEVKLFPDILSRKIAWQCDDFDSYQVSQSSYFSMTIGIVCPPEKYEETKKRFDDIIADWMEDNNIDSAAVNITFSKSVVHQQGGKLRKIQRHFGIATNKTL